MSTTSSGFNRRVFLRGAGAVTASAGIAAFLAACSGGTEAATDSASDGPAVTSVVVAAAGIPTSWAHDSGVASTSKYDYLIAAMGFLLQNPYVMSDDGVTMIQDIYNFEGQLAESYEVSDDGLVYTFHLRPDVLSAAGNPFTVDDVLWSYERKFATKTSSVSFVNRPVLTDPATQFAKIDDLTFTITLAQAGYGFTLLSLLANSTGGIFDSTLLKEHVTPEDPYAVTWSDTNFDSSYSYGPYIVESVDGDTEMVLAANPNWWGGTPTVTKITFRAIPDPGTRATALKTGEVQAAMALRPIDTADLATSPDVSVPDNDWSNAFLLAPLVTNKAPFDNVLVRQAFAYAVPYEQIIESVYHGRATKPAGFLDPEFPSYDASGLPEYDYDTKKAKALLTEAGTPTVSFKLTYASGTPDTADAAVQIQSLAADAGFTIELEELPLATFTQGRAAGEYQAMLLRDAAIVMAPSYEMLLFTGRGSTTNYPKWEDESFYSAVDAAIAAGDATSAAAGTAWNAAESILLTESPIVFIAKPKSNWAVASTLTGQAYRTDGVIDYSNVS